MKRLSFLCVLMVCLVFPALSSAAPKHNKKSSSATAAAAVEEAPKEDEFVDFSNEQRMLNNQAADATKENNYEKAEQLYTALLQLGEVNIVWHNLGRTYAKQNKCLEAFDAFARVDGAPKMRDLPPEDLHAAKEKALNELNEQCSAKVVMKCNPAEMKLSVDGGREFQCNGQSDPIPLTPGRHSVHAKTDFGFNTITVNAAGGEVREYKVDVINYEEVAAKSGATIEALEKRSKIFTGLGWGFVAGGVAIAGTGAGLATYYILSYGNRYDECITKRNSNKGDDEQSPLPDKCKEWAGSEEGSGQEVSPQKVNEARDKANTMQTVGWSLVGAGGALIVTGVGLLIFDMVKIKPQLQDLKEMMSFSVDPVFSPGFSGLMLTGSF